MDDLPTARTTLRARYVRLLVPGVGYCEFCRHTTYLPCRDAEKAERCQLAGQAAVDYDCAEAACEVLFEQWWELDASKRRSWRAKMIKALAAPNSAEARFWKGQ